MESIGARVKWARELRGLTQAALAKAACMLTSAIADLEAGVRDRPRDLTSLAAALGVRPEWLEEGKGEWKEGRPGSKALQLDSAASRLARTHTAESVGQAIVELGALLSTLSPLARASIAPLVLQIANDPSLAAHAAELADAIAHSDRSVLQPSGAQVP